MDAKTPKPEGMPLSSLFRDDMGMRHYKILMRENPADTELQDAITSELYSHAQDDVTEGKTRQKRIASKPRPKPTLKSLVMSEMRKLKNKDHTFDNFMDAAQEDSIDGLSVLKEEAQTGKNKGKLVFVINLEGFAEEKLPKTLLDWWTDSTK